MDKIRTPNAKSNEDVFNDLNIPGEARVTQPDGAQQYEADPLLGHASGATPVAATVPSKVRKGASQSSAPAAPKRPGYVLKIRGMYLAYTETGKRKRPYEIELILPNLDNALSVLKNSLLGPALKRVHTDFAAIRTHEVINVTRLTPDTPPVDNVRYMGLADLSALIKMKRLAIDAAEYGEDVIALRESVQDALANPGDFLASEKRRVEKRRLQASLAELNPQIFNDEK